MPMNFGETKGHIFQRDEQFIIRFEKLVTPFEQVLRLLNDVHEKVVPPK